MSGAQSDISHIFNILRWIKRIEGISAKKYEDPEDYKDLLSKNLENIGNSLNKISKDAENMFEYSQKEWGQIIGFRNISAHTYETISLKEVQNIVDKDIPVLKQKTINAASQLINKSLNESNSLEFVFNNKIYSIEPIFNSNNKINIVIDGNSFISKPILKKDISAVINNIINGNEITNGISPNRNINW